MLQADARKGKDTVARELNLLRRLERFDEKFFEDDSPVVDTDGNEKMCVKTTVSDETGDVPVKLWDRPCSELLHVTASKLRTLCESKEMHQST